MYRYGTSNDRVINALVIINSAMKMESTQTITFKGNAKVPAFTCLIVKSKDINSEVTFSIKAQFDNQPMSLFLIEVSVSAGGWRCKIISTNDIATLVLVCIASAFKSERQGYSREEDRLMWLAISKAQDRGLNERQVRSNKQLDAFLGWSFDNSNNSLSHLSKVVG